MRETGTQINDLEQKEEINIQLEQNEETRIQKKKKEEEERLQNLRNKIDRGGLRIVQEIEKPKNLYAQPMVMN